MVRPSGFAGGRHSKIRGCPAIIDRLKQDSLSGSQKMYGGIPPESLDREKSSVPKLWRRLLKHKRWGKRIFAGKVGTALIWAVLDQMSNADAVPNVIDFVVGLF